MNYGYTHNLDECHSHYAEQKQHIVYDSIYMNFKNKPPSPSIQYCLHICTNGIKSIMRKRNTELKAVEGEREMELVQGLQLYL